MIRRPPRSTRTDTLFPYTTLFRSAWVESFVRASKLKHLKDRPLATFVLIHGSWHGGWCFDTVRALLEAQGHEVITPDLPGMGGNEAELRGVTLRSEERRVGKECVSTCRSRWSP